MKHALIVGHPDPNSLTKSLARRYAETAAALGHEVIERDLYRIGFEPRLGLAEMADRQGWSPAEDVLAERALLGDVDVFAFFYPLWFNAPPAIIIGYIDRVFGAGFGYEHLRDGGQNPLLRGRQLVHVTTSGSRTAWLNEHGGWVALRTLFDDYLARLCGMRARPRIHFDAIVPGLAERWVREALQTVDETVREYFGSEPG